MERILKKYDGRKLHWLHVGKGIFLFLLAWFLVFRLVLGISRVEGNSMTPTLHDGTVVVFLRTEKHYRAGDIAVLRMPSGEYYVKRVAAVGEDVVELREGRCFINGLPETGPFAQQPTEAQGTNVTYPFTVPEGRYFVMGDNRRESVDSRTFRSVSNSQMRGKVLFSLG